MPTNILMPALSPTMTEGTLAKWMVKEGDEVSSGDILAEIETDKATMEVEAVDEGTIGKIIVPDGTESVAVNSVIAILLEEGESADDIDVDAAKAEAPPAPSGDDSGDDEKESEKKESEKKEEKKEAASPAPAPSKGGESKDGESKDGGSKDGGSKDGGRIFASPLAKRMAKQAGLDLASLKGSGPHGRIIKADIEAALEGGAPKADKAPDKAPAGAPAPAAAAPTSAVLSADDPIFGMLPEAEKVSHSNMRKTIAKRLTESARDVPHFNLQVDVEIDKLMALRKELNEREGADYKISVNDFIVKATALALTRVPDVNVAYTDSAIMKFKRVDMAIAVAIEGGLITPIIKDCAGKGLATISKEAKELAGKAREGKLKPEEYQGGTFSISNLGMFGIKSFNSIINAPQGGILSVGAGEQRPVVKDGALSVATVVSLSLAVDHRCIDGATGAEFMKELKSLIEDPIALML